MVKVRTAGSGDAEGMLDIYAPYILNTAFTFETEVPGIEVFALRIMNGLQRFPWIVCTVNDTLAGYVYASPHREREAYQWTCECSVYIREEFKGNGIGKDLYGLLFQLLKMQGLKNVYAGITLPNEASVRLHEKCGFRKFATYENIGYKLGSWQKVGWWKLQLSEYDLKPPPPVGFSLLDPEIIAPLFSGTARQIESKLTG